MRAFRDRILLALNPRRQVQGWLTIMSHDYVTFRVRGRSEKSRPCRSCLAFCTCKKKDMRNRSGVHISTRTWSVWLPSTEGGGRGRGRETVVSTRARSGSGGGRTKGAWAWFQSKRGGGGGGCGGVRTASTKGEGGRTGGKTGETGSGRSLGDEMAAVKTAERGAAGRRREGETDDPHYGR